jgi:hypothetical protein
MVNRRAKVPITDELPDANQLCRAAASAGLTDIDGTFPLLPTDGSAAAVMSSVP